MYQFDENNNFIINDFLKAKSFSSFLPGLVGEDGIPIWVFYVNRGQAISSFGIENKNSAITEFFPADKAYQYTPYQSFRTFIKLNIDGKVRGIEPFSKTLEDADITEQMTIHPNYIELTYRHESYQLEFNVRYYIMPSSSVGALVREVKLKNLSNVSMEIELVDGLASIFPADIPNLGYKEIGNTLKSWFDVEYNNHLYNFYYLRGSTDDTEHIEEIENGNFYTSLVVDSEGERVGDIIYDRRLIFGEDESLTYPYRFMEQPVEELLTKNQYGTNKLSGGFTLTHNRLAKDEEIKIYTLIGHGETRETVEDYLDHNLNQAEFEKKFQRVVDLPEKLVETVRTKTADSTFDRYVNQMYMDNGLRGGFPRVYEDNGKKKIYYMYSRKHGDLERDYNFFSTSPTYYSQGNGNYRDMNQNRRLDVIFHPEIEDYNIQQFINLIQLDGYNPLEINKVTYQYEGDRENLKSFLENQNDLSILIDFFENEFEPGDLLHFIKNKKIILNTEYETFLSKVLNDSAENLNATHGEGYWIDHWTYNLDLIDSFLDVFPDKQKELFFEKNYKFYKNKAYVKPRKEKYQEKNGQLGQYNALVEIEEDSSHMTDWAEAQNGELIEVNLYSKLLLLAAIKTATIAPYGYGIEMEAGKPGWNDALNGLPGIFGASTSELYELKRLIDQLSEIKRPKHSDVSLPEESYEFIQELNQVIKMHSNLPLDDSEALNYWDESTTALEDYRLAIYKGVGGEFASFSEQETTDILEQLRLIVDYAIKKVEQFNDSKMIPTYFYFDGSLENGQYQFKAHAVAPFLEGNVKRMKLTESSTDSKELYTEIRQSEIFDEKLEMYKTSVSTADEPEELGRIRFFTRGWLENESVFLHMEYKYLLEILRAGLYEEYYKDIHTMFIPFLDPKVYGRNILENSTFIASSANPNPSTHGRGYVARLSGSTVEFLHMWKEMFIGAGPYKLDQETKELVFYLAPVLDNQFFTEEGEIRFTLFNDIEVTYQNVKRANTYGKDRVKPIQYDLTFKNGTKEMIKNNEIHGEMARAIREKRVKTIDVILG